MRLAGVAIRLAMNDPHAGAWGIWGGTSQRERRQLKRRDEAGEEPSSAGQARP